MLSKKTAKQCVYEQCSLYGLIYTVRTKLQKILRSYVEGVYTIQNGAYERNSLTAYSVGGYNRVVNGPTSSGPNPARTQKLIWSPNHAWKISKVKLGLENSSMLPN